MDKSESRFLSSVCHGMDKSESRFLFSPVYRGMDKSESRFLILFIVEWTSLSPDSLFCLSWNGQAWIQIPVFCLLWNGKASIQIPVFCLLWNGKAWIQIPYSVCCVMDTSEFRFLSSPVFCGMNKSESRFLSPACRLIVPTWKALRGKTPIIHCTGYCSWLPC